MVYDHEGNEMDQCLVSLVVPPGIRGDEKKYGDVYLESQVMDPGQKHGFRYVENDSSGTPDGWYYLWTTDPGSNQPVWSRRHPPYLLEVVTH